MHSLTVKELMEYPQLQELAAGSTFGALSDQVVSYMLDRGEILLLRTKESLYQQGDLEDSFYIVLHGVIRFSGLYQQKIDYVRDFTFGEQIGFVSMVSMEDQVGSARAEGETIVLKVSHALFFELHEKYPSDFGILMLNLSRELARRIREMFLGSA